MIVRGRAVGGHLEVELKQDIRQVESGFLLAQVVPRRAIAEGNVERAEYYPRGIIRGRLARVLGDLVYANRESREDSRGGLD